MPRRKFGSREIERLPNYDRGGTLLERVEREMLDHFIPGFPLRRPAKGGKRGGPDDEVAAWFRSITERTASVQPGELFDHVAIRWARIYTLDRDSGAWKAYQRRRPPGERAQRRRAARPRRSSAPDTGGQGTLFG